MRDKIDGMVQGMKQCSNFKGVVVIRRFDGSLLDTSQIERTERLEDFLRQGGGSPPPITRVGFQDPAMIFYSSGTTGTPKAIVHGVGTLLISLAKEARLHHDFARDDVCLQYTTTGWIMYVMSVGQLLLGGRTVFYDGSPLIPDRRVLLQIVEQQGVTVLGTSPRWMGEIAKAGIVPRRDFDLSRLRLVTSTGMVLPDQLFEWFYDVGFDPKVHLSNISGGTDIVSHSLTSALNQLTWKAGRMLRAGQPSDASLRGRHTGTITGNVHCRLRPRPARREQGNAGASGDTR